MYRALPSLDKRRNTAIFETDFLFYSISACYQSR